MRWVDAKLVTTRRSDVVTRFWRSAIGERERESSCLSSLVTIDEDTMAINLGAQPQPTVVKTALLDSHPEDVFNRKLF
jgi:hypothetical protein